MSGGGFPETGVCSGEQSGSTPVFQGNFFLFMSFFIVVVMEKIFLKIPIIYNGY